MKQRIILSLLFGLLLAAPAPAAETAALATDTPWRVFLMCRQQDRGRGRQVTYKYTGSPPANWTQADFDDSGWGRYGSDLSTTIGGYGCGRDQSSRSALICLRTRFGIAEPTMVRDLTLSIEYRGGAVVYVNGREIARQHLPKGPLEPQTFAEAYPAEAFTTPTGEPLPSVDRPALKDLDRYEQRIRRFSVAVPAAALRQGANTLAVELHAAPTDGRGADWSTTGLCDVKLTSQAGTGVAAYAKAIQGTTLWNATPLDTVANVPGKRQSSPYGIANTPVGLTRGNPFEPLRPIRAIAPRGGTCSGQVVVSGPGPLSGLKATLGPLRQTRGNAVLPAESVRVGYAIHEKDDAFCSALQPQPAADATVQPIWVLVDVPRNQPPGWYTGTLTVAFGAETTKVPVQVLVAPWTLTDPKDNATFVSLYQSPDTLAQYYKVEPWSDRHFALIERSMTVMAGMGNDVLLVPVILDNYLHHATGLVRWVRKGAGFEPEFSAFERYLDLHTKVFGKPKVVTLSIWKHAFGTRRWFRGMVSDVVKPCLVTELDPRTGEMKPMQAPHFGEPGSEEFWKTMIEGVRRIVKSRGCDDRFLLLGEPFDSRPLVPVVDFFKKIEPTMRWQIYSHFDGGEPRPKDGKWIVHGGFELGFCIGPNAGGDVVPEFGRNYPKASSNEYISAGAQRFSIAYTSSPLSYRMVMRNGGAIARIGLDFWPVFDIRGRTYYSCPPGEAWLWRCHVPAITAAGPDGAVRTTRGQMLLEGLQEAEVFVALMRAKQKAAPELAARIEQCFAQRRNADMVGGVLSQAMISLDLGGMAAREYAIAAELAGTTSEDDWSRPPTL